MLCGDFGAEIDIKADGISRWMANFRQCTYWSAPAFGGDFREVPDETQCLYEKTDKPYGVIIPLVTKQYKCVLAGGENGLYARLSSFYDLLHSCKGYTFVYAEGKNPFELLSRCAKAGVQLINNGCRIRAERHYWDMWWTDDGQAEKNSILRAISGEPIYVSDQIGRSRRDLLMSLILEDGHILRCDRPGVPNVSLILPQEISEHKKEPQKRSATIRMTVFAFTALYFIDYSSTSMVLSTSTSGSVEYTSASSGASSSSGAASS